MGITDGEKCNHRLDAAQWLIIICGCRHKMKCEIYALFG